MSPSVGNMSRRDLMFAKIRGDCVSRLPFATYNFHRFGRHAQDPSYATVLELAEQKAGLLVKHSLSVAGDTRDLHETSVERTSTGTRTTTVWHTPKGDLRSVTIVPDGQPGYVMEHFIKDSEDIERVMSVAHVLHDFDVSGTRHMLDVLGDRGVLYVGYPDPMYSAASLFEFEDFTIRCLTDADRLQDLIEYFAHGIYAQVERMAQACEGMPILFCTGGPEIATPPMLPPSVFARFVTPFQKHIIAIFHRHGHLTSIHCHGRVRQVLDEILETGTDVLEPIEPPEQGDITLAELLERVDGRMCLMGYIQDQDFYLGSPGHMRRCVEAIVATVDPTARYIMTPTCTPFQFPASRTYVDAYTEWIEAAYELLII